MGTLKLEKLQDGWQAIDLPKWRKWPGGPLVEWGLYIAQRPYYCDRGRFIVHIDAPTLDGADGFPRYYYDWDRMLAELDAWMAGRQELVERRD